MSEADGGKLHSLLARLHDANRYNAALVDAVVDALVQIDEDGIIQVFNRSAEAMFGWQAAEVVGRNVHVLMPEPMAAEHDQYIRRYLAGGPARIIGIGRETLGRRRDGSVFPIDLSVGEFRLRGRCAFIGVIRDISERKAIEAELGERQRELQSMYEQAPVAIATLDTGGAIASSNAAFAALVAQDRTALAGTAFGELLAADARAGHEQALGRLRRRGQELIDLEYTLQAGAGGPREVAAHYALIELEQQAPLVVVHLVDRTAQIAAEREAQAHRERLAHVDRLTTMGELASGIAHEVNQPLTAIAAYARACQRLFDTGQGESPDFAEALEQIAAQATRAGEIVHRLRSFARRGEPEARPLAVAALVDTVIGLLRSDLKRAQVELELAIEDPLPPIIADAVQIQQVLVNLLRNALEAMAAAGTDAPRLQVRATADAPGSVTVSVTDNGGGIPEAVTESLFEPFSTSKPSGMGLGLAISKSIIEAHGGELWCASALPRGATFSFKLPVSE